MKSAWMEFYTEKIASCNCEIVYIELKMLLTSIS